MNLLRIPERIKIEMIRYADKNDIPRISEIIVFGKRMAYRSFFRNDIVSFNELQVVKSAEEYNSSPRLWEKMLVYDDGIIKGVINRKDFGEETELCEFYVEPFFKGEGIGRKLISFFIDEVKKEGKRRIFLWVIKDNEAARRFYERNGFVRNGEDRLIEGTDVWDICYELILW